MAAVFFNDGPLFKGMELTTLLASHRARALEAVSEHGWESFLDAEAHVDATKQDDLVEAIAQAHGVERLEVDYSDVSRSELSEVDGVLATTISLPFTGDHELWHCQINHIAPYSDSVRGNVASDTGEGTRLVFWLRDEDLDTRYDALLKQRTHWLQSKVDFVNREVDRWTKELATDLAQRIAKRAALMSKMRAAEAAMTIPVRKRSQPPIALPVDRRTLQTPVRKASPTTPPTTPPTSSEPGNPEPDWVLEDAAFDEVVRTLVLFAAAAGRLPASIGKLEENDFRNFALLVLNANFHFTSARGEVFNGKGKSDLLVPWGESNALVGEFKKFDGAKTVTKALSQLLGYVTWADTKACLVMIIDRDDVTNALTEMHGAIEGHPRHVYTHDAPAPDRLRTYTIASTRDDERHVRLAAIPIVVDREETSHEHDEGDVHADDGQAEPGS